MTTIQFFAAPYMGFDKSVKDPEDLRVRPQNGVRDGTRSPWFQALYNHSNFDFMGVYLTHTPIPRSRPPPRWYAHSACHVSNQWTRSWDVLAAQGWGGWFIYAGWTTVGGPNNSPPTPFTENLASTGGVRHARHVKTIISEFNVDQSGAAVYIDNEGGILNDVFRTYYRAFFEELRRAGPGRCQPCRPGIYARDSERSPIVTQVVEDTPDLLVWRLVWRGESVIRVAESAERTTNMAPIPRENGDRLFMDPTTFDLDSSELVNPDTSNRIVHIPIGQQCMLNYAFDRTWYALRDAGERTWTRFPQNFPSMPTRQLTPELNPVNGWDFDTSFVRDPRFPEASPRIGTAKGTIVQGHYNKNELRMSVSANVGRGGTPFEGTMIEPEAPLLLPTPTTLVTIDRAGNLTTASLSDEAVWSRLTNFPPIPQNRPLRRLRALTCCTLQTGASYVFYLAKDRTINYFHRPNATAPWQGPVDLFRSNNVAAPTRAHAFSNLACTSIVDGPESIILFILTGPSRETLPTPANDNFTPFEDGNPEGVLKAIYFTPSPTPNATNLGLITLDAGNTANLFLGSSLLAISPHPKVSLVFGINRSSQLVFYWRSTIASPWSNPKPISPSRDATLMFAHTRLAANIIQPTLIDIAGISLRGDPVVYTLWFDANKTRDWILLELPNGPNPRTYRRERTTPPRPGKEAGLGPEMPLGKGEGDARQWSINPWGDIKFGLDPSGSGETVLICAGCGPANAVAPLYRRINKANEDWYLKL